MTDLWLSSSETGPGQRLRCPRRWCRLSWLWRSCALFPIDERPARPRSRAPTLSRKIAALQQEFARRTPSGNGQGNSARLRNLTHIRSSPAAELRVHPARRWLGRLGDGAPSAPRRPLGNHNLADPRLKLTKYSEAQFALPSCMLHRPEIPCLHACAAGQRLQSADPVFARIAPGPEGQWRRTICLPSASTSPKGLTVSQRSLPGFGRWRTAKWPRCLTCCSRQRPNSSAHGSLPLNLGRLDGLLQRWRCLEAHRLPGLDLDGLTGFRPFLALVLTTRNVPKLGSVNPALVFNSLTIAAIRSVAAWFAATPESSADS